MRTPHGTKLGNCVFTLGFSSVLYGTFVLIRLIFSFCLVAFISRETLAHGLLMELPRQVSETMCLDHATCNLNTVWLTLLCFVVVNFADCASEATSARVRRVATPASSSCTASARRSA